jgi:uroporphyrinogen decarboxylase
MLVTSRERLLTVLKGGIPDCVPVAPDFSNMIPARLTGKPFWDLYLYNDPPIWEAYIACAKHFNIDSLMDGYFWYEPAWRGPADEREISIVFRSPERLVTQACRKEGTRRIWADTVTVYYVADPPTSGIDPAKVHLPKVPLSWEPLEGVKSVDHGPDGLKRVKRLLGDQGLVGVFVTSTCAFGDEGAIYRYYDNPDKHEQWAEERVQQAEQRFHAIMAKDVKPDFFCVGGSGTLVFQTLEMFRKVTFPAVKRVIELASAAGIPTHVHSCGPEKELVKIMAEETGLTVIDPLEISPMGDCDLAELKRLYGRKLTLKGNLHTTEVMLKGSVKDVIAASKKAIDDAAEGGRFILSTGDQCGRDTPDDNLRAMIETARTHGRY